jgi:phage-related protein
MTFGAIKNTVSGAWQFIRSSFSSAVDFVGGLINRIGGFFSGVWNGVKGGVAAAMGAVKGAVSGTVNWIIDKINTVIRGYQKTAGKLPGAPSINEIPKLAKGGIVMPTPGGTIAQIAEAGEAEAVIPLSKLDAIISGGGGSGSGGSKITQYNTIYTELDMNVVNRKLTWELGRA